MADINQGEIARVAALGAGKKQGGEDEGGSDNALMELLTNALNRVTSMIGKAGLPGASVISSLPSTGVQVGLESPEGFAGKKIQVSQNFSGADGALYKIFAALKKGGMSIKNLTEGIEPQQAPDVSWAQLGELPSPITPNTGGTGISMDM
jgi:hypothetical protein